LDVSPLVAVEPAFGIEAAPAELAPLTPLLPPPALNKPGSLAPPQPKIRQAIALGANK
jgi:hypothetical protein